jgi:hypothetical protein
MLIAHNYPAAEVIDASVRAFAEVCHAQEKSLVRQQLQLLAYTRAIGAGQITSKRRWQRLQGSRPAARRA